MQCELEKLLLFGERRRNEYISLHNELIAKVKEGLLPKEVYDKISKLILSDDIEVQNLGTKIAEQYV